MWRKVDVVFRLKSPLHIGYLPFKGSVVSPTRYYVLGRNLWGAITKRITEFLCEKNHRKPKANDYKEIGKQIMDNFRFSYFYLYDGRTIYFPRYTDEGLKYGDNRKEIAKSEFEHRFIGSFISTAIDNNGTAKDRSLHEIEFINNRFKDENGDLKDVKIAGCIWIKENVKLNNKEVIINDHGIFIDDFNVIRELILGGESKYGFGHVVLESVNRVNFPVKWKDSEEIRIDNNGYLIAHLKYDKSLKFKGDIELIAGRGYYDPNSLKEVNSENKRDDSDDKPGQIISTIGYYFSPGTMIKENKEFKINWDGTLEVIITR